MINIFLSASIPLPDRNPMFIETADVVLIRDAIKSLVSIVVPKGNIIFGGHPAITPLVAHLLKQMDSEYAHRVILYQSMYFQADFIKENDKFIELRFIDVVDGSRSKSLNLMREKMLNDTRFDAGVFIGGMEGVKDECFSFREAHPNALLYPVASTGAAALEIYNELHNDSPYLLNELSYPVLFRDMVKKIEDSFNSIVGEI